MTIYILDLNAQVERYDYQASREKSAAICLPTDLKFETVRLHLICEKHSFELHVDLHVSHNMSNTREDVKQYILLVPQSNEIGISSRGEARFHVMVDTSGTQFMFGMLQTQVTMLQGANVQHDSAYSFLPDDKNKRVRLRQISSTETEYHADIVIMSNILPTSETMIAVLAACTHPRSMIQRLDMKQVRYLKRHETGSLHSQSQPLAIIDQHDQTLQVIKRDNALMRCKAFGYPRPNIALYRTNGVKREPYTLASYTTSLQFEKTTVFQLLNATDSDSGKYICKAFNANTSVEKGYTVKVVS